MLVLPHLAISWNFILAENLASLSLQDGATKWNYYPQDPTRQPASQPSSYPVDYKKRNNSGTTYWHYCLTSPNPTIDVNEDNLQWKMSTKYKKWNILTIIDHIFLKS